jgi:hypothetical protein
VPIPGGASCLEEFINPSILIVNGDLSAGGTPTFFGIVYVIGNVDIRGNSTITGAIVTGGGMANSTGGSTDIWYDSDILNMTRDNGTLAAAPGSWHDW